MFYDHVLQACHHTYHTSAWRSVSIWANVSDKRLVFSQLRLRIGVYKVTARSFSVGSLRLAQNWTAQVSFRWITRGNACPCFECGVFRMLICPMNSERKYFFTKLQFVRWSFWLIATATDFWFQICGVWSNPHIKIRERPNASQRKMLNVLLGEISYCGMRMIWPTDWKLRPTYIIRTIKRPHSAQLILRYPRPTCNTLFK